jgi:hypothetical protein
VILPGIEWVSLTAYREVFASLGGMRVSEAGSLMAVAAAEDGGKNHSGQDSARGLWHGDKCETGHLVAGSDDGITGGK